MTELLIDLTDLRDLIRMGETEQAIDKATLLILRERRKLPKQIEKPISVEGVRV